jgi:putative spermidine/putrescine transport system permease protein
MSWYNSNNKKFLYLLPGLLFVLILVAYGLLQTIIESFADPKGQGLTFANYSRLFEQKSFWDSLVFSLRVSFISTVIALTIGIVVTKFLHEILLKKSWKLLIWLPMLFPHFIAGYLILLLFAPSGLFSTLASQIGIIDEMSQFPVVVIDRQGVGIILTYIWKEIPFVVLMLLPVFAQIDNRYKDVVRTLGGGKWETFQTVEWPWLFPVVVETGLIIFAFVFAAFEVPYLLGATYPKMLPVLAYQWFFEGNWSNRPLAMASMLLITAMIMVLAAIFFYLLQKKRYRMMRGN